MSRLTILDLSEAKAAIKMDSTLANPSADFVQALLGFPTAAGKPVTKDTAIRVASFLAGVKVLASDIAKMPLLLRSRTVDGEGRVRTQPAIANPLYTLLKDCPNQWQTSYQMRWFLASQLIMASNCFCQIIRDQTGKIIALNPLDAWNMTQKWDLSGSKPRAFWVYSDLFGNMREFQQSELWHTTSTNLQGNGMNGAAIVALAKEALSLLLAQEEVAGRNFANGLSMGGFLTLPPDTQVTEPEAQNIVDTLKKNFSGSQNAAKFSLLPGGVKFEKMAFNAQESQFLESRKWDAEEVTRLLGGAPLLVKLGMGQQSSTYASSSAFLEDYFQTSLMPHCVALEQSITRDLILPKDRATVYAKHDSNPILRGSLRERAETYEIQIRSGQMSPNEVRVLEDQDTVEGLDWYCLPANTAVFNDGEIYIPGQDVLSDDGKSIDPKNTPTAPDADPNSTSDATPKTTARLLTIANSLAERVERKEAKGTIDAKFISEVLACSLTDAEAYIQGRKDKSISDSDAHAVLVTLATKEN
jgi:HK97 family phage portal protein